MPAYSCPPRKVCTLVTHGALWRRWLLGLVMFFLSLSAGQAGPLTVDVWSSTASQTWSTAGNWSTGVPTASSIATFNARITPLKTTLILSPSVTAASLVFSGVGGTSSVGANFYTFDSAGTVNNNTLTLTAGITDADLSGVTFYNATTLGASQTWTNTGGPLIFAGKVNLGSGSTGNTLTVAGSGNVNLNGTVANGGTAAGSLVYSGTGTLTMTGANTYTGGTTLSSGTLLANNGTALGSGALALSGGTLSTTNYSSMANAITLQGNATLSGTVTSGTLTQTGGSYTLGLVGATQAGRSS